MLIDCSYFTAGPRHILNATMGVMQDANAREVNEAIESYITRYQRPFLRGALGDAVTVRVEQWLSADKDAQDSDTAMSSLVNSLREPYADYVFYMILRFGQTRATMTGAVRLKSGNEYVSPARLQTDTWNAMADGLKAAMAVAKVEGIVTDPCLLAHINVFNL